MNKRLLIATAAALICGVIDWRIAALWGFPIPAAIIASIIVSRGMIGFAIGISSLKRFPWWGHGMLLGVTLSLPMGVGNLAWGVPWGLISCGSALLLGTLYGLLTELSTTVFFDLPMKGKKGL